jgi:hypothetical protein
VHSRAGFLLPSLFPVSPRAAGRKRSTMHEMQIEAKGQ